MLIGLHQPSRQYAVGRAGFRVSNDPNPMCFYRLASALKLYLGVNWKAAWYL